MASLAFEAGHLGSPCPDPIPPTRLPTEANGTPPPRLLEPEARDSASLPPSPSLQPFARSSGPNLPSTPQTPHLSRHPIRASKPVTSVTWTLQGLLHARLSPSPVPKDRPYAYSHSDDHSHQVMSLA